MRNFKYFLCTFKKYLDSVKKKFEMGENMSLARNPRQYTGVRAIAPPDLVKANKAPTSADIAYVRGTLWLDIADSSVFMWPGSGDWISLGSGTTGAIVTLTGDSGGAISPVAGNIDILGTANQITTAGTAGTITFTLPAAIVAPGSLVTTTTLEATTTITAGTGLTVTTGDAVVSAGDIVATLGDITASAGDIAATLGSLTAGTSVTAGTSITATAGDITATLGNVIINGAAKQLRVHGGAATDFIGQTTLVAGVSPDIANTNISASDKVFVSRQGINSSTALGVFDVAITASTKFVITARKPADATTETGDTSIVDYFIVRQV